MKKIIKELKSQNILHYIFAFSAVVILIITVMGAYLYNFYYQTIYSDFKSANREHVLTLENHHESALQIVEDIGIQIGLSEGITKFDLAKSPQKAVKLEQQLYQYTMVSHFFDMIAYHYHNDTHIYNHSTSVALDYFLEKGCVLGQTDSEQFRKELSAPRKPSVFCRNRIFRETGPVNIFLSMKNSLFLYRRLPLNMRIHLPFLSRAAIMTLFWNKIRIIFARILFLHIGKTKRKIRKLILQRGR